MCQYFVQGTPIHVTQTNEQNGNWLNLQFKLLVNHQWKRPHTQNYNFRYLFGQPYSLIWPRVLGCKNRYDHINNLQQELGPKLTKPWRKNCLKYTILYKFRLYRCFTGYTFSDSASDLVNYEVLTVLSQQ